MIKDGFESLVVALPSIVITAIVIATVCFIKTKVKNFSGRK